MRTNSASRRGTGRRRRSGLRSFVTMLQIIVLLCMGVLAGLVLGWFGSLSRTLPNISAFEAPEATLIYSSDGVLLGRVFRENRTNVPLKDIPKDLKEATVAIEDSRFYEHSGVDIHGVARAVWENVRGRRLKQGGSTITQQLARNVYLTQHKTIQRKIQEIFLAILIERNFTKEKILELYLNQVFYGSGSFGVQAASRIYFGKDVKELDLSESALIAGLPQQPTGYSPHRNLEAALNRRDVVLNRMAQLGYISPRDRDRAKAEHMNVVPRRGGRNAYKAPHFVDYVTNQLRERYGDDVLYGGGLRVYTTLNYRMQEIAERALREGVRRHERAHRVTEGCFVAIDPTNGAILAMVGSVDPKSEFNRCTQAGRQPGSSFKAFVYTAALEAGWKITKSLPNVRVSYPGGNGHKWTPKNYDGRYGGSPTMETAVAKSINLPAIYTAKRIGVKNVIKYARLMGIHSPLEPYLPIAIGGIPGLHPIEMASAYGTFANDGAHVEPLAVTRIANSRDETQADFSSEGQQVISKKINADMDHMLRAVVTRGTGRAGASAVPQARGKTGTTNNDVDAWWIGYVPKKIVAACWVGNDNNSPMSGAYGGVVCAPIWREFMLKAIPIQDGVRAKAEQAAQGQTQKPSGDQKKDPNKPDQNTTATKPDVTVADTGDTVKRRICNESQLLATKNCPSWHTVTFESGTEPTTYCTIHGGSDTPEPPAGTPSDVVPPPAPATDFVTVTVCAESGLLAGRDCPRVRKRVPVDQVPTEVCRIKHDQTRP